MKLGLINSAWAQTGRDTAYGIRKTHEIGFDTIDIDADPLVLTENEQQVIISTTRDCGLPIVSVCCVALGLSDYNESVRHFHFNRCKRYLDLCASFGARNLLLVIGEYIWQQQVIPPEQQWAHAVQQLQALGEHGIVCGVNLALELEPFELSLINSVESMAKMIQDVGMPDTVRANCDISHLHLTHTEPAAVAQLKGLIEHVHLSDCDGQVHGDLPPGRGVTPVQDYLAAIKETGYDGAVSLELEYAPDPAKIEEWVQEAYEETDKIMQALDCRD